MGLRTTYGHVRPAEAVLTLPAVQSAEFWGTNGLWRGVVGAGETEYNVVQERKRRWYASDDNGVRHYGRTAKAAMERAIRAQN